MIELTEPQRQELQSNGANARVVDPASKEEYVLVRAAVYARLRVLVEQAEDDVEQDSWGDLVAEARSAMASE